MGNTNDVPLAIALLEQDIQRSATQRAATILDEQERGLSIATQAGPRHFDQSGCARVFLIEGLPVFSRISRSWNTSSLFSAKKDDGNAGRKTGHRATLTADTFEVFTKAGRQLPQREERTLVVFVYEVTTTRNRRVPDYNNSSGVAYKKTVDGGSLNRALGSVAREPLIANHQRYAQYDSRFYHYTAFLEIIVGGKVNLWKRCMRESVAAAQRPKLICIGSEGMIR